MRLREPIGSQDGSTRDNTIRVALNSKELQDLLDELEASRASRKRAWENLQDRQIALDELLKAVSEFRKYTDQPLTLREGNYARAVQALNKAIDRAQALLRC
jgi:hypothetical protein